MNSPTNMDRNARLAVERGGNQQRKRVIKEAMLLS